MWFAAILKDALKSLMQRSATPKGVLVPMPCHPVRFPLPPSSCLSYFGLGLRPTFAIAYIIYKMDAALYSIPSGSTAGSSSWSMEARNAWKLSGVSAAALMSPPTALSAQARS